MASPSWPPAWRPAAAPSTWPRSIEERLRRARGVTRSVAGGSEPASTSPGHRAGPCIDGGHRPHQSRALHVVPGFSRPGPFREQGGGGTDGGDGRRGGAAPQPLPPALARLPQPAPPSATSTPSRTSARCTGTSGRWPCSTTWPSSSRTTSTPPCPRSSTWWWARRSDSPCPQPRPSTEPTATDRTRPRRPIPDRNRRTAAADGTGRQHHEHCAAGARAIRPRGQGTRRAGRHRRGDGRQARVAGVEGDPDRLDPPRRRGSRPAPRRPSAPRRTRADQGRRRLPRRRRPAPATAEAPDADGGRRRRPPTRAADGDAPPRLGTTAAATAPRRRRVQRRRRPSAGRDGRRQRRPRPSATPRRHRRPRRATADAPATAAPRPPSARRRRPAPGRRRRRTAATPAGRGGGGQRRRGGRGRGGGGDRRPARPRPGEDRGRGRDDSGPGGDNGTSATGAAAAAARRRLAGEPGNRRSRRRRGRDRGERDIQPDRGPGPGGQEAPYSGEPVPVDGLLDLRDEGYGFLRTNGYLAGPKDVYVSLSQVRRFAPAQGRLIKGASRPAGSTEKYPALLRIDTVNDMTPDEARNRPRFEDLTPLFPDEKLRLEIPGDSNNMVARIVDLISPIGKGQRGLIVSPPKAGKTTVLKQIAHSIEANNPDVHLMVLLVDERPEEVTDMRRSVKGEVVAVDLRPSVRRAHPGGRAGHRAGQAAGRDGQRRGDRARRHHPPGPGLQPGRARHRAASCRVVSTTGALYPPKKFFGSARNIEEGGSLTILATALIETGSQDGRGHLRGVQGHRQHGAAPRPQAGRAPHLPGPRRQRLVHPPRGAAVRPQPAPAGLEAAPGAQRPRKAGSGPRAADGQDQDHPVEWRSRIGRCWSPAAAAGSASRSATPRRAEGARVAVGDLDVERAESTAAEIRRREGEAHAIAVDVADPASAAAVRRGGGDGAGPARRAGELGRRPGDRQRARPAVRRVAARAQREPVRHLPGQPGLRAPPGRPRASRGRSSISPPPWG